MGLEVAGEMRPALLWAVGGIFTLLFLASCDGEAHTITEETHSDVGEGALGLSALEFAAMRTRLSITTNSVPTMLSITNSVSNTGASKSGTHKFLNHLNTEIKEAPTPKPTLPIMPPLPKKKEFKGCWCAPPAPCFCRHPDLKKDLQRQVVVQQEERLVRHKKLKAQAVAQRLQKQKKTQKAASHMEKKHAQKEVGSLGFAHVSSKVTKVVRSTLNDPSIENIDRAAALKAKQKPEYTGSVAQTARTDMLPSMTISSTDDIVDEELVDDLVGNH